VMRSSKPSSRRAARSTGRARMADRVIFVRMPSAGSTVKDQSGSGVKDQPERCQSSGDAGRPASPRTRHLRKWS
jgi:hypothetical protein